MSPHKVIVVGTTPDYVARLYETYPARTCFAVDSSFKGDRLLEAVDQSLVLFTDLEDSRKTLHDVDRFLSRRGFCVDLSHSGSGFRTGGNLGVFPCY